MDVLRSLGAGPHALHELKEVTQLPSSTLCKIMASAIALGVVRKHGRGYYEPCGPAPLGHVFVPADEAAQRLGIPRAAWSALVSLQEFTGDLVALHCLIWNGLPYHLCTVAVTGADPALEALLVRCDPRSARPLTSGAVGHAMRAALRPRARQLAGGIEEKRGALWSESPAEPLESTCERGYARTVSTDGYETLAVAQLGHGEVCGALSVTCAAGVKASEDRAAKLLKAVDYVQALLEGPRAAGSSLAPL
ncbi:hypothetical protein [Actinospica robiniae]|uniref:hypothetical protein n=1 Tax=Actinospica robiniae TaxID=304901 RepID=UPI00041E9C04|nr:hypothetical protein [Actinospica robiniae]